MSRNPSQRSGAQKGTTLEETLGFIQRALDRIQAGEAVEAELHNVRAYLHEAFLRFGDRLDRRGRASRREG